jgi:hypothetical protein
MIAKVQDMCTSCYLCHSLGTAQFATRSKVGLESHVPRIGCPVALKVCHKLPCWDSRVILRTRPTSSTVATAAMDAHTGSHSTCDYPATG